MVNKNNITRIICGLLCFLLPLLSQARTQLSFGVYTSDKPTEMVRTFRPLLKAIEIELSKRLGNPVNIRLQVARNYATGIEDLVQGKVDFARFGPASYIKAKRLNPKIKILALESSKGNKVLYGIICVGKNSKIQNISDLKGATFAFGNRHSTTGRYLSQLHLAKRGITSLDLSHYEYLDRHDTVGMAVGAGKFDAGALKEGTFNKLLGKGIPIRAIAKFPNATKPWIARKGLSPATFSTLQEVLLQIKDPKLLKKFKRDGFLPGDDQDFQTIRSAIEENDRFFTSKERQTTSLDTQQSAPQPLAAQTGDFTE